MPTDPPLQVDPILTLAQWLSPSYPVGAFSYSHGLEWAVQSGQVHSTGSFENWLADVLRHGAGHTDALLLIAAYHATDLHALGEIDDLARALAPSSERLLESTQQGQAFCQTTQDVFLADLPPLSYPVAVGYAAAQHRLPLPETARFFLHAFASSLTSAAIRLVPLGQTDGQRILAGVTALCQSITDTALAQSLDDLGSSAFAVDIASMQHETQYSRLFRS